LACVDFMYFINERVNDSKDDIKCTTRVLVTRFSSVHVQSLIDLCDQPKLMFVVVIDFGTEVGRSDAIILCLLFDC